MTAQCPTSQKSVRHILPFDRPYALRYVEDGNFPGADDASGRGVPQSSDGTPAAAEGRTDGGGAR